MSDQEIFSSTGDLGISRRQDQRLYLNAPAFCDDANICIETFERMSAIANRHPGKIGRVVVRGIVSDGVIEEIGKSDIATDIEVVVPLYDYGHQGNLLYLARNHPNRTSIATTAEMIEATNPTSYVAPDPPLSFIERAAKAGHYFATSIASCDVDQLHQLWGKTFGWDHEQVANLAIRLNHEQDVAPEQRSVWISLVKTGNVIVSAAMAERLELPAQSGHLNMIESTEWRTRDGYQGRGLMAAALSMLNAQLLEQPSQQAPSKIPFIFAECNFQARSDKAGHQAGLTIPSRQVRSTFVTQAIIQNVNVCDGQPVPPNKLRDFSFMRLEPSVIYEHYSPAIVTNILNLIHER